MPADPTLSFVAWVGTLLVGANLMTPIRCGATPALLLGPLTVDPPFRSGGVGEALVRRSLAAATEAGHSLVLLVGDHPYYRKFGFEPIPEGRIAFCGPVDPARLLYRELVDGAFASVAGTVRRAIPAGLSRAPASADQSAASILSALERSWSTKAFSTATDSTTPSLTIIA